MSEIKIGLIGYGAWVKSAYLPALQYDGRARVAAVAAASEQTRRTARRELGQDTAVFADYRELLRMEGLDAVMIAVPDQLHQEALSASLEAGLPVFYEPPVTHLRRELPGMSRKLLAAEQLSFAHLELSRHPAVSRASQLIRDGAVGPLQSVSITLNAGWGCTPGADLTLIGRMTGWYVDVLNHLADGVPSRALLLDGYGGPGRMQASGMGIYDYGGIWGVFRADVCRPGDVSISIEASGTEGRIAIDYFSGRLRYQGVLSSQAPVEEICPPLTPTADYPGVRETVTEFLDAVAGGSAERGNAKAVAQLNSIALAIEESKDTGTWAEVKGP